MHIHPPSIHQDTVMHSIVCDTETRQERFTKTVLCRGPALRKPTDGSVCCVLFQDVTGDFKKSKYLEHATVTLTIGSGLSLADRLVEECIETMSVQEESKFSVAFKDLDFGFTATLTESFFKPYTFQMPDAEKLTLAQSFKNQGTGLFKENKLTEAFGKFRRALQYLLIMDVHYPQAKEETEFSDEAVEMTMKLLLDIYNNIAFCHLSLENFQQVIMTCSRSLDVKPNVKAYYRRALAYIDGRDFSKAEEDLVKALEIESTNQSIIDKLSLVRELDKSNQDNYRNTVKKMFS